MKTLRFFFRDCYRKHAWLPFVATLAFVAIPGTIFSLLFSTANTPKALEVLSTAAMPICWLLALVSIVAMYHAGKAQQQGDRRWAGAFNILMSVVLTLLFLVPVVLFFLRPPGVGNS